MKKTLAQTIRQPHYRNPPVIEVVCGVQFDGIEGWATSHYGKFWSTVEAEYPLAEDHPPIFRLRVDPAATVMVPQLAPLPPLRRVFFLKPPGNLIMQVQHNRFLHNWRKIKTEDPYPRFDKLYPSFEDKWAHFKEFVLSQNMPEPQPDALELTYINHIGDTESRFPKDVWKFLNFYPASPEAATAPEATAEATTMIFNFGWPLPDDQGQLALDVKHGNRAADDSEVLVVELSVRGKPKGGGAFMKQWFDAAHIAIVKTFDSLTTKDAHRIWGKYS